MVEGTFMTSGTALNLFNGKNPESVRVWTASGASSFASLSSSDAVSDDGHAAPTGRRGLRGRVRRLADSTDGSAGSDGIGIVEPVDRVAAFAPGIIAIRWGTTIASRASCPVCGTGADFCCVALAGIVTLAPTLAYNLATTGSATTYTYALVQGTLLGLDQEVPWGPTLTALRGLGLTAVDAHQLNVYLLDWPVPVTVLAAWT